MLYIPKIDGHLEILSDEEVKNFVAIILLAKLFYIFLATPDEVEKCVESNCSDNCVRHYNVEISNLLNPELQLINTKPIIKNKLKELLSELNKKILVLDYKKGK